jgi:5-methylcytosine-specific restriction enzyme A
MPSIPKRPPQRPWQPVRTPHAGRTKANDEVYNSTRWRRFRLVHIQANPLCVQCAKVGRIVAGRVVDHIKPINQGGEVFDANNVQTLCDHCHNIKSGKEAHTGSSAHRGRVD